MSNAGLFVYRVISDTTNESLPDAYFSLADAVKMADSLKDKAKDKLDFRVVKTIPVYTTKAMTAPDQDDLI